MKKREYGYHAARTEELPTGKLRVSRLETGCYWGPSRHTWFDRNASNPLENQIAAILYGFQTAARELKEKRAEREREKRRRHELERQRQELEERRAAHAKLRVMLDRQAGAWYRARLAEPGVQMEKPQSKPVVLKPTIAVAAVAAVVLRGRRRCNLAEQEVSAYHTKWQRRRPRPGGGPLPPSLWKFTRRGLSTSA